MPAVAMTRSRQSCSARLNFIRKRSGPGSNRSLGARPISPAARTRIGRSMRDAGYHFTLLAQDETGYRNLVKLISAAHLDGFHYRPRIDKELAGGACGRA